VSVPSIKAGTYTLQVSLNTNCALGTLLCKREVVIDDGAYDKLAGEYAEAVKANKPGRISQARAKLLGTCFKRAIKPGEKVTANQARTSPGKCPSQSKFLATFVWIPKADCLNVTADVVDANYAVDAPKDEPYKASCVEFYVSPAGVGDTVNQFFVVPDGDNGQARVTAARTSADGVKATWKRTAKGYALDVSIPWADIKGYEKGWNAMPVEAMVNCRADGERAQLFMNRFGEPWKAARTYALLRAK